MSVSELKHILLVEDDPTDVEFIMTGLAENNLANMVFAVQDGAEALDYLYYRGKFADRTDGEPVVILLDLKLPKIDGLEVLRQIKTDEKLKCLPIVILISARSICTFLRQVVIFVVLERIVSLGSYFCV